MRAAVEAVRQHRPSRLVVAAPVAAPETCAEFEQRVDEVVCARSPDDFHAVGAYYENFEQTTDAEVREILSRQ